ncbi:hypothetical protein RHGRI_017384 [Rhododendron griersonianum]|uniref:Bulb-type lectin domain-containing protein n=1 Tax=Rhododendron griersonianum TaxID=479676 RepID=A0AAV6JXK9_9ERIC|nr:hypothetical protein RHGRI_017384 [Rhododendron griersonianum]
MTPVLSPSSASQFVSGFYCFSNGSSCFFGIVICGGRYQEQNYAELDGPQPVWSANRDRPVEVNATLKLTGDGDLILEDADGDMVWSTNTGGKSVMGLRFTEFGNLVLFDSNNATVWQSFDHPTDSLLIGQKLVSNSGQKLIARTSSSDFSQGLFSLSVQRGSLFGYVEANPPLVYYKSNLERNQNFLNSEKEYVVFENGRFNGQTFALGSTAQFMRLEPDGHLKVYEWVQSEWKTMADLLTSRFGDCGYPTYTRLVELKNISYFTFNWRHLYNELDEKTGLEDCKNACLRNCSCKAALFVDTSYYYPATRGCMLLSEVFSLIDDERGSDNTSIFLKVPKAPSKQHYPLPPIDFPRKKSTSGKIILGSSLGALFGVCLLVGSCIFVFKMKREPEEPDEFSIDKVLGMPTRFSYNDLKTATNDFRIKLGEGGFGSVFQGTLSDGTEVAVKRLAKVVEMMKLVVWCLQSDYQRRPSMTVVVQVLEGFVSVQDNLDFNFINGPARRTIATTGDDRDAVHDGTTLFASDLSGPRSGGDDEACCAVSTVRSDYERRASMTVVVQVLEGFVSVQDNLDYYFINAPVRRTMAATGEDMHA